MIVSLDNIENKSQKALDNFPKLHKKIYDV